MRRRLAALPAATPHPHAFCRRCGRLMLAPKVRRTCDVCGDVLPPPEVIAPPNPTDLAEQRVRDERFRRALRSVTYTLAVLLLMIGVIVTLASING